jgi:hypothetical protein
MSAPLPLHSPDVHITRTGLLAAASVVVATCSVAATLAVAGGGTDGRAAAANSQIETAKPDAAILYHHGAVERRR